MGWLRDLLGLDTKEVKPYDAEDLVDELNTEQLQIKEAGSIEGEHYTDYVEQVKQLKREWRHPEAIDLLLKLVGSTEEESRIAGQGWGVAPWYYEQLAIIYRKEKRFADEVAILEQYEKQEKAPGIGSSKLAERLVKAREKISLKYRV